MFGVDAYCDQVSCLWRFDVDLAKVNEMLRNEKQTRDKLQRERDELAAEKYTADQELKVCTAALLFLLICISRFVDLVDYVSAFILVLFFR